MPISLPRLAPVALAVAFASAACGASNSPGAATARGRASGGGMASTPHSVEEYRTEFISTCLRTPDLQAFCDCGWEVFSSQFTAEEIDGEEISADRLELVQKKAETTCLAKMPE